VDHDHGLCIDSALARADGLCDRRGARLTALRRRVLELVWQDHTAVKAYDLLRQLGEQPGAASASVKPPTVYRALDFLLAHGLIHRLESLNAYVGCPHPDRAHDGSFLICERCGKVREVGSEALDSLLDEAATDHDFTLRARTVELRGICRPCQGRPS